MLLRPVRANDTIKATLVRLDEEQEAKINDLKSLLVDKLLELTEDKVSQGIKDYSNAEIITKGAKFTMAALKISITKVFNLMVGQTTSILTS